MKNKAQFSPAGLVRMAIIKMWWGSGVPSEIRVCDARAVYGARAVRL